jgi:pyruvate/2-oxoglutarate dehydrogenase complex dihydrolipoamide dehydrogenase (E3) component
MEEYDLVIIGSGSGGKLIAWAFASKGQRVAMIERKYVGGSCPNIACLPSKNIIHTAQVAPDLLQNFATAFCRNPSHHRQASNNGIQTWLAAIF